MSQRSLEQSLVLMYHGLDPGDGRYDETAAWEKPYILPAATFAKHLDALNNAGRQVQAPGLLNLEDKSNSPLKSGQVLLTFDDGLASDFDLAWPALSKQNMSALFFITTNHVGTPGHLTWDQLRTLSEQGAEIGAHGATHKFFDLMSASEQQQEMQKSFEKIREELGKTPRAVSLPGGRFDRHTFAAARAAGFRAVFTSRLDRPQYRDGLWVFGRVAVRTACTADGFTQFLAKQQQHITRMRWGQRLRSTFRGCLGSKNYDRLFRWMWQRNR